MLKRKLFAGVLAASLVVTALPASQRPGGVAKADAPAEIELPKTVCSNPIGGYDADGNLRYGGDPAILVEGDTVYLYTGHDVAVGEGYSITEWLCYSTKDLMNWNYEGVIMGADKQSITWANTGTDAWAAQVAKYKDKYYLYFCTWDATSAGKQSIGVAVSDSPTGPFKDIGEPLVKGTVTEPETSGWNDIDPTVWIETDDAGVEHRYLAWGNGKYYVCELNEDMVSVKDLNGDGKITCGTSKASADILDKTAGLSTFTEAPWLYRRQDENGKYYGKYYLFYAYGWREQMAYATTDNLLDGSWEFGKILMPPAATSNTNHMAVFDFKGKTYFVYHNGMLPAGTGFRRIANITELHFDKDGNVEEIPETTVGIGGTPSKIYAGVGGSVSHANFVNSSDDGDYPYLNIKAGVGASKDEKDAEWVLSAGKADKTKASYVSIQSENKPGLYLTVNDDKTVTLAQDAEPAKIPETAKKQTFRSVQGLADADGVSFESVSQPGLYLTVTLDTLSVTDGSDKNAATFYVDRDMAQEKKLLERFKAAQFDEVQAGEAAEYEMIVDDTVDNCLVVTRAIADADKTLKVSIGDTVLLDTSSTAAKVFNETLTYAEQKELEQIQIPLTKDVLAANSKASSKDDTKKAVTVKVEGDVKGNLYTRRAYSTDNSLTKLTVGGEELTASGNTYSLTIPYAVNSISLSCAMSDANGYLELNGAAMKADTEYSFAVSGKETVVEITAVAEDYESTKNYTLKIEKDYSGMKIDGLAYAFGFEDKTDGAKANIKVQASKPAEMTDVTYQYTDGVYGKAIVLNGTHGLKLCDANKLGNSYTISFWMKPDAVNGAVDPTLAAGTFSPEYWLNLTFDAKIWSSKAGGPTYIASPAANVYQANKWQHVAVTVDGNTPGATAGTVTGKLFVDGKLVSTGEVVDGIMTNTGAEIYFGVNGWDAYFKGALDDVMMFDKALTDDEVGAIADKNIGVDNAGAPKYTAGEEEKPNNDPNEEPEVKAAVKKVVITKKGSSKAVKKITLKKGKSVKLAAKVTVTGNASKKVSWKTANKKRATVSSSGVVKAKKKGTVKITAVSKANSKKKCTITIKIK